jgi:hypothetical protein
LDAFRNLDAWIRPIPAFFIRYFGKVGELIEKRGYRAAC